MKAYVGAARRTRRRRVETRLPGWDVADVGQLARLLARYNAAGGPDDGSG